MIDDSIVETVISKFRERSELGKKKYGVTLDRTDLSLLDWIRHAQEEHMDAILYLEKLKQQYESEHCKNPGGVTERSYEPDEFSPVVVYLPAVSTLHDAHEKHEK
jgi:hypothetical protein